MLAMAPEPVKCFLRRVRADFWRFIVRSALPQHANGTKSITKDRGAALQPYLYRTKMVLPEQIVNWP